MRMWMELLTGAGRLGDWAIGLLGSNAGQCQICGRHRGEAINPLTTEAQMGGYAAAAGAHAAQPCLQALCGRCWEAIPWVKEHKCLVCGRSEVCEDCSRRKQTSFLMNRSAVRYDAAMKQWLARYKYRGDERLGAMLSGMLFPAYEQMVRELTADPICYPAQQANPTEPAEPIKPTKPSKLAKSVKLSLSGTRKRQFLFDAVTYVPVSQERARDRGFNQSEQLAGTLASRYGLPLFPTLARMRDTGKQSFKSREQRLQSLEGVFAPVPAGLDRLAAQYAARTTAPSQPVTAHPAKILLVDDVYTTGATIEWCARTLAQACEAAGFCADIIALTWARS